jgi:serine/threonine protein kinase
LFAFLLYGLCSFACSAIDVDGQERAIKIISIDDEVAIGDVRREVEILSTTNNPNIVQYFGMYHRNGYLWIVMEFCGGGSVSDLCMVLQEGFSEPEIAYICSAALQVLADRNLARSKVPLSHSSVLYRYMFGGRIFRDWNICIRLGKYIVISKAAIYCSSRMEL